MTRHSTLTNPADLHYAKVRTFTGEISLTTPDFIDQILIATDTNKAYRSTGTNAGAIVELVANPPLDNPQQSLVVGIGYPDAIPSFIGQQYFDQELGMLFFSKGISSVNDWLSVSSDPIIDVTISTNEPNLQFLVDQLQYDLYYSASYPIEGFNFSELVSSVDSSYSNLRKSLRSFGTGYYALVPKPGYSYIVQLIPSQEVVESLTGRLIFALEDTLTTNLQANSRQISSTVYHFKEFPLRDTNEYASFVLSFVLDNFF